MLQYSVYSVISPEGCASILWKSAERRELAAEAMGITAERLSRLELVDEVIPEPAGGAHRDPPRTADAVGKVLRITRVGLAPPDNPFYGNQQADPRVYAYGLRNPFGVAADPFGQQYVLDNGEIGFDTVHELEPGENYGWPASARANNADVHEPLQTYQESLGLAGATVYRGKLSAFDGDLFFCQFHRGGALHWFPISDDPIEFDRILTGGCSSAVHVLPDENLYLMDYFTGTLYRITN